MSRFYSDKLDANEQISAEEAIAALLFDKFDVSEVDAQPASQQILLMILDRFRPDLMEKEDDQEAH